MPSAVDMSHQKSGLLHNCYDAFIFHWLNAVVSEVALSSLFCLVFISYPACRPGPEKVPLCLALSIAVVVHAAARYICLSTALSRWETSKQMPPKVLCLFSFFLFVWGIQSRLFSLDFESLSFMIPSI